MNRKQLFRKEVFAHKMQHHYGTVLVNTPIHYSMVTIGTSLLLILLITFFIFAEFSEKFIVKGYLNSTKGIIRVYPKKNGVISKIFVQQGKDVKKGDKIFLIDTSQDELRKKNHQTILEKLQKQLKLIKRELINKKNYLTNLKKLLNKKYISLAFYNQKLDQFNHLKNNQQLIELEIIKYKQERSYIIHSPSEGRVVNVIYKEGQFANITKPLVKILPKDTDLIAELFIPVKQSGFLERNSKILIRYDAYPSERFGSYQGVIKEISQSILLDDEEEKPVTIGQPYYKATAVLANQFIPIYGRSKKLQHGMTLSATIIGQRKKLWQWVLDPLFSFYGDLSV